MPDTPKHTTERPPVVAVMGHIDHGKSTLLDYIRKTNVAGGEAGGITQHISAYEVTHKDEKGQDKKITFLDTPGHEAFSMMRNRGARIADIAILVVSAEDSVKPQTLEALHSITTAETPYIVAINKIDKPGANIEKVKTDLSEHGVYLEGYGGSIPCVPISAKTGDGIDALLDLVLIASELEELSGTRDAQAEGIVLEANLDQKRGVSATIIIKDGTLKSGMFVVVDGSVATTRIMEDFLGNPVKEATFSSPVRIVGFDTIPDTGARMQSCNTKKEALSLATAHTEKQDAFASSDTSGTDTTRVLIPIIIKADTAGSVEALEKELGKLELPEIGFKIISKGVGAIGEADGKTALSDKETIVIGFNVKIDAKTKELLEQNTIRHEISDIIYTLSDALRDEVEVRRPRQEVLEVTGSAKIQRTFSKTRERQVVGGKVQSGKISVGNIVRILRRDFELGRGKIIELQTSKVSTKSVEEGAEFGMMLESRHELAPSDVIESFMIVTK